MKADKEERSLIQSFNEKEPAPYIHYKALDFVIIFFEG